MLDRVGQRDVEAVEDRIERRDLGLGGVDPSIEDDAPEDAGALLPLQGGGEERLSLSTPVHMCVAVRLGDHEKVARR